MEIMRDWICEKCHETGECPDRQMPYECPKCGGYLRSMRYIICEDCGERIYLGAFTNECDCGAMYNPFGQRLAPVSQWSDEDRYDCFGPQNYYEEW